MKALLAVKTSIPPTTHHAVNRTGVKDLLAGYDQVPLVLFCAPAGYGKTTAVRSWLRGREDVSAWVSLDEGDNDRQRFWR